jgi:hypothetical protein
MMTAVTAIGREFNRGHKVSIQTHVFIGGRDGAADIDSFSAGNLNIVALRT